MKLQELYDYFDKQTNPKFFLTDVFSWRGNYEEVAFTPSVTGTKDTTMQLIKRALRHQFKGYKGGVYKYNKNTEVHFEFSPELYNDSAYGYMECMDGEPLNKWQKEYMCGLNVMSKFTVNNIFEKTKNIVRNYINNDIDIDLLNKCNDYTLDITKSTVNNIEFEFGKCWEQYHVKLNCMYFSIIQQEGHSNFTKQIININTSNLFI